MLFRSMTQRWYNGLVNVRGTLYGVIDLADFCGLGVTPRSTGSVFVMCGQRHGVNAGLLVRRIVGLRNAQEFQPHSDAMADKPWFTLVRDHEGRECRDINVAALMRTSEFMEIAVEKAA